jgi:hypothetical protein
MNLLIKIAIETTYKDKHKILIQSIYNITNFISYKNNNHDQRLIT